MALHCPRASCEWCQLIKPTDQQLLVDRVCIKPDVTLVEDPATGNLRCESFEARESDVGAAPKT